MRKLLRRSSWPAVASTLVVAAGIGIATAVSLQVEKTEHERWRERAHRDALMMTDQADVALMQAESLLRSFAALFYASHEVAEAEFMQMGRIAQGKEVDYGFRAFAYAERVTRDERAAFEGETGRPITVVGQSAIPADNAYEYFPVTLTHSGQSLLFRGTDLASLPAIRAAVASAYRNPHMVMMSPAFELGGHWWSVMALRAPNNGRVGVVAGLLDLSRLFSLLERTAPTGLVFRLSQSETAWSPTDGAEAVLGHLTPSPDAAETFEMRVTHGEARWKFAWDVLPGYGGGHRDDMPLVIMLGGSLFSILIALLIGTLLHQNVEVRRRVRERTNELARARDEAELANRTKTEFLATMSHELRTPLNAILGFSEVIRDQIMGPVGHERYREYASNIHESGHHLLGLINDILDVAKAESGKMELAEERISLAALMDSCARLISAKASTAGLKLLLQIPEHPSAIVGDSRRIRQILINLLGNAVKFTPATGTICLGAEPLPGGRLRLFVKDTGIGMREEDIPTALAPFSQIDSSLQRKFDGTGLGLPLAKRLAELHDAELSIETEPGQGTTVRIDLPAYRVAITGNQLEMGQFALE